MKKLLILEVDSFLLKVKFNFKNVSPSNKIKIDDVVLFFSIPGFDVYLRKDLREVLDILYSEYDLALWSTTLSTPLLTAVCDFLFDEKLFVFIWGKERCSLTTNKKFFIVERRIETVFSSPEINLNRKRDKSNTLLIGESFKKFDLSKPKTHNFENSLFSKVIFK